MSDQELLFKRLKEIKDYWVKTSFDALDPKSDLIWSDFEQEYAHLQKSYLRMKIEGRSKELLMKL